MYRYMYIWGSLYAPYIHIYIYIYIHICILYICTYLYVYIYVYLYIYIITYYDAVQEVFFFIPRNVLAHKVHEHVYRDDLSACARRFPAGARAQRSSLGGGLCSNSRCAIGLILFSVFTCVSLGQSFTWHFWVQYIKPSTLLNMAS